MKKDSQNIVIMQQVLDPSGSGGVSAEYRALAKSKLNYNYCFVPLIWNSYHKGFNLRAIWFYYNNIKKIMPDIIQIRGAGPDGLHAVIAAKMVRGVRIMVCVHGMYSDLIFIGKLKRWLSKHIVEALTFGLADGISCVYKKASERKIFYKYKDKMLPFVYNRMPDYKMFNRPEIRKQIREQYSVAQDSIVGIYCGRVSKEKGIHILFEALSLLDEEWPTNFKALIVGDGQYLPEFKSKIAKLRNKDCVICLGNQRDIYRYLFASDFFIQPSLHENHSVALLEACAAYIPSIATDVGGNIEIISDGTDGLIIEKNNVDALYSAIKKMVYDHLFLSSCIINLKKNLFELFRNEYIDCQLKNAYTALLKNKESKCKI